MKLIKLALLSVLALTAFAPAHAVINPIDTVYCGGDESGDEA